MTKAKDLIEMTDLVILPSSHSFLPTTHSINMFNASQQQNKLFLWTKQHFKRTRIEYVSSGFENIYFLPMPNTQVI